MNYQMIDDADECAVVWSFGRKQGSVRNNAIFINNYYSDQFHSKLILDLVRGFLCLIEGLLKEQPL